MKRLAVLLGVALSGACHRHHVMVPDAPARHECCSSLGDSPEPGVQGVAREPAGPTRIGVLLGSNAATMVGPDAHRINGRPGILAGIVLVQPWSRRLAVETGLLYAAKGGSTMSAFGNAEMKMDFVEAPLLLRFHLPGRRSSGVSPFLTAGGAVSFTTRCDIDASDGRTHFSVTCEEADAIVGTGNARFQTVDASVLLGAGVSTDLGSGWFGTIAVRFGEGLTTISDQAERRHRVYSVLATVERPLRPR